MENLGSIPCWYGIHTKLHQEQRAENNLRAWGVETFAPKLKDRRVNEFTGRATYVVKPFFPRYIFASFCSDELLHEVSFTRGVHRVVRFGDNPIPIDDEIIAIIRSRQGDDGFIKIGESFEPGDKVMIDQGPFKNFMGVFERRVKDSDRVRILLSTVNFQTHLLIEQGLIRKIDEAA